MVKNVIIADKIPAPKIEPIIAALNDRSGGKKGPFTLYSIG